ncbi:hypothetical protein HZB60_10860 [candidate division KSB1 bacterium]|nr:hypothetical protein [candidate division KSB1 bacterium]
MTISDSRLCSKLAGQSRIRFSGWADIRREIPAEAGVYTIWRGRSFLYVGVAGTGKKHRGLRERLKQHHDGKRGMDKFSIYVFDRFVLPELTKQQIRLAARGELALDEVTASFVQEKLTFSYLVCSAVAALRMETAIKQGKWDFGIPLLNAAKISEETEATA